MQVYKFNISFNNFCFQSPVEEIEVKENDVTSVAPEYLIKHPLQNVWTLWYFEPIKGDWLRGQREITNIDTVEDFWRLFLY